MTPPIESTNEEITTPRRAIKVSREGLRKQKAFKSKTASMINRTATRQKKTAQQLEYLNNLFKRLKGNWSTKVKREAMKKTGLTRQ